MALEETVLNGEECDWCNLTEKQKKYLLFATDFWSVYLADEQDYVGRCVLVLKRNGLI